MVSDLLYVHIPRSFGCTLRGFKNPRFHVYEKDAQRNLDSGGPILAPRSLFSSGFVKKNVVFFVAPNLARHFFYGQQFPLTGNPHVENGQGTLLHVVSFPCVAVSVSCCLAS